jgi:serine-type D-Ala-D-Ala carboxypeptidase/endopeptidase
VSNDGLILSGRNFSPSLRVRIELLEGPFMLDRREFLLGSIGVGSAALGGCAMSSVASEPIQAMLKQAVGSREKVGMVAVVVDGRGTRMATYGHSGVADVALDGDTVFEIMSITKVLTSLILADMVGRGELGFDDPVAKYLPRSVTLAVRGRPITLLDLATYTSGLPNMPGNLPANWYANPDPLGGYTVAKLNEFLSGYMPEYEPGTHYRYANLGFGLLGNALAQCAGKSYEQLLIERVCNPLDLDHTRITLTNDMQRHLAQGQDLTGKRTSLWNFPALPGAGTVRTNAKDLTVFLKACMGLKDSPLTASLIRLRETRRPTNLVGTEVALGWYITSSEKEQVVWKTGLSGGCNTFIGFSTRARRGALLFSNFLWQPIDEGTINMGMKLINPALPSGPFGKLYSTA